MRPLKNPAPSPEVEVALDTESVQWSNVVAACAVSSAGDVIESVDLSGLVRGLADRGLLRQGVRHWAHAGGIHDFLLILPWAVENGWNVERAILSGGSLIALDLRKGSYWWILRDSYRVLPDSLKKVGKAFGVLKDEVDRENIESLSVKERLDYCTQDCRVLLNAILSLTETMRVEGGSLGDTLASTVASLVRLTLPADCWGWNRDSDSLAALAYYGGKTERYRHHAGPGVSRDINSAYPAAMIGRLPTRYLGIRRGMYRYRADKLAIVRARVKVPSGSYFGPLPVRPVRGPLKGRLVFPTGEFEGYWTAEELIGASRLIPGFDWYAVSWAEWESEPWLAERVSRWFELKSKSTGAKRYTFKIFLNSLYGKFIEQTKCVTLTQSIADVVEAELRGCEYQSINCGKTHFFAITEQKEGALRFAACAAHITQRARTRLLELGTRASRVDYSDTDSLYGIVDEPDSAELGGWSVVENYSEAEFIAPKVYAVRNSETGLLSVKAKGFPKPQENIEDYWNRLKAGETMSGDRARLLRSSLRRGTVDYARVPFTKSKQPTIDKRYFEGNESRPWSIKEIDAGIPLY